MQHGETSGCKPGLARPPNLAVKFVAPKPSPDMQQAELRQQCTGCGTTAQPCAAAQRCTSPHGQPWLAPGVMQGHSLLLQPMTMHSSCFRANIECSEYGGTHLVAMSSSMRQKGPPGPLTNLVVSVQSPYTTAAHRRAKYTRPHRSSTLISLLPHMPGSGTHGCVVGQPSSKAGDEDSHVRSAYRTSVSQLLHPRDLRWVLMQLGKSRLGVARDACMHGTGWACAAFPCWRAHSHNGCRLCDRPRSQQLTPASLTLRMVGGAGCTDEWCGLLIAATAAPQQGTCCITTGVWGPSRHSALSTQLLHKQPVQLVLCAPMAVNSSMHSGHKSQGNPTTPKTLTPTRPAQP